MRRDSLLLAVALGLGGCAHRQASDWTRTAPPGTGAVSQASAVIVTPAPTDLGRVASVNPTARYVVITYPVGVPLPPTEHRLNVYRAGLKVAEVKVSKERMDVNITADIVVGDCQVGDEVREN